MIVSALLLMLIMKTDGIRCYTDLEATQVTGALSGESGSNSQLYCPRGIC